MSERHDPKADQRAMVIEGEARFTILTPAMIRMEHAPGGAFEDRASQAIINRRLDVPEFSVERTYSELLIRTSELTLRYQTGGGRFDERNLSVELNASRGEVVWRPGTESVGNLFGTTRTLDGVSGSCELEQGLLSRDGWALIDDTQRPLFDGGEWDWMTARSAAHRSGDAIDWYFLGYGLDYPRALSDYTRVAGRIPMVPRYVLGTWWSRYWPYSDEELKGIVGEFDAHSVPLDVLVIDMDWHLTGWTGYSWNPACFPDPEAFLAWCHDQGLRTTLNLHPADGVGKHEVRFNEMRAAMGGERSMYRVPFDCSSKRFMRAYFDILHHPIEEQGVDFWWMDWQQGAESGIKGVDPLWWLNHLHWQDMQQNASRADARPLIFSRWGGLGNHRYQIGFSGDTYNDWGSLAFQPYFTATAGNVGYAYWSHDIGGHQPGPVEDELYTRWVQFGAFSPVLRTHAGCDPKAERRIWKFRPDCFEAMRQSITLRYELLPYIYTATRRTYDEGRPLCVPLYHEWPEEDEAYARPGQYLFGNDLMLAPVTRPMSETSGGAPVDVWIPPGRWAAWCSGAVYEGPRVIRMLVPLDEIPIFVRDGALVPAAPPKARTTDRPDDPLIVHVFPGERGASQLYEDDGLTLGYQREQCARTELLQHREGRTRRIRIGASQGTFEGMPSERPIEVRIHGSWPASEVLVNGEPLDRRPSRDGAGWWYDSQSLSVAVRTPVLSTLEGVEVAVESALPAEADAVMDRGLRGQFAVIDDVAKLLGAASPDAVMRAREIRRLIEADPEAAAARAESLQQGWWALVEAINACKAPPKERDRALCRLLGLSCTLTVEPDQDGAGLLLACADVAFAPRFQTPAELGVEIKIGVSDGWQVIGGPEVVSTELGVGGHARARATVAAGQVSDTAVGAGFVTVAATIREGGTTISLTEEAPFFPSINAWWIVGPFGCPFEKQAEWEFVTPDGVDINRPIQGADGIARSWKRIARTLAPGEDPSSEFMVDLNEVFGAKLEDVVAYAYCELESPDRREVELALGSDDSLVVWLNGKEVHRKEVQRGYRSKEDRVIATLSPGRNALLVKIGQAKQGWAFGVHVDGPTGLPDRDVRVVLPKDA